MSFGDLTRINTNLQSLQSLQALQNTNAELGMRQMRLATGSRINRAEDDSAGYSIAAKLQARVRGQAQALANVATVLRAGGARPEHLLRLTWYVTDRAAYLDARAHIGIAYRRHFDRHFPAMTVVIVAGLLERGALVEIEATAVIPD